MVIVPWCCVFVHPATVRQCYGAWIRRAFVFGGCL